LGAVIIDPTLEDVAQVGIFAVLEDSLPHISAIMGFKEGDEISNLLTCR
jgi:hypothetical protein